MLANEPFRLGNVLGRLREHKTANFPVDFRAQSHRNIMKTRGRDLLQIASGDFVLDFLSCPARASQR